MRMTSVILTCDMTQMTHFRYKHRDIHRSQCVVIFKYTYESSQCHKLMIRDRDIHVTHCAREIHITHCARTVQGYHPRIFLEAGVRPRIPSFV